MLPDKSKLETAKDLFDASRKGTLWTPRNIILAVVALLYFLSPIDLVPEFLFPLIGWLDDVGIVAAVICWIATHRGARNKQP